MRVWAVAGLALTLTGCFNSVGELRSDPDTFDGRVDSNLNVRQVYRHLRDTSKNCLERSPLGTPVTTESEFDGDLGEGQIRLRMVGQGVMLTEMVIDVTAVSDTTTSVKLYSIKGWNAIGVTLPKIDDIRRWAAGDTACQADSGKV